MNPATDPLPQIATALSQKTSGLILLGQNPQADSVASAIALFHGLTKMGKNVAIVSATPPQVQIPGVDKIQSSLSTAGNNLVISLPYQDGSIDKVDYNIQGNRFNLIITPKEGFPKLNSQEVQYSYTGGSVDFIVTIDTPSLKNLGNLYTENQKQFEGKTIINIDRRLTNAYFGTVNVVSKTSSSTSEIIIKILKALQLEIDRDMATILYTGVAAATNNFTSYSVNALTFETAALLLKLGAVKRTGVRPASQSPLTPNSRMQIPYDSFANTPEQEKLPVQPKPQEVAIPQEEPKPIEEVEIAPQQAKQDAPEDWLKPKIFKGGGGLV